MRKQDKAIVWPAYFDQARTRKEGRRVPRNLAIPNPKIEEIQESAQRLGLKNEVFVGAGFSKTPWQKTGLMKVEKKAPKGQIIYKIAKQLVKTRNTASSTFTEKK